MRPDFKSSAVSVTIDAAMSRQLRELALRSRCTPQQTVRALLRAALSEGIPQAETFITETMYRNRVGGSHG